MSLFSNSISIPDAVTTGLAGSALSYRDVLSLEELYLKMQRASTTHGMNYNIRFLRATTNPNVQGYTIVTGIYTRRDVTLSFSAERSTTGLPFPQSSYTRVIGILCEKITEHLNTQDHHTPNITRPEYYDFGLHVAQDDHVIGVAHELPRTTLGEAFARMGASTYSTEYQNVEVVEVVIALASRSDTAAFEYGNQIALLSIIGKHSIHLDHSQVQ